MSFIPAYIKIQLASWPCLIIKGIFHEARWDARPSSLFKNYKQYDNLKIIKLLIIS